MERTARMEHAEVREIAPSHHCVLRFRQRAPVREPGRAAVVAALIAALEGADVSAWPPAWAAGDHRTELWAINGNLAFPLERSTTPGRFVATTCLSR